MPRAGGRGTALYPYFQSTVREQQTTVRKGNSSAPARRIGNAQRLLRQGIADVFKKKDEEKRCNMGKYRPPIDQNAHDPTTNLQGLREEKKTGIENVSQARTVTHPSRAKDKAGLCNACAAFSYGRSAGTAPTQNEENQCRFCPRSVGRKERNSHLRRSRRTGSTDAATFALSEATVVESAPRVQLESAVRFRRPEHRRRVDRPLPVYNPSGVRRANRGSYPAYFGFCAKNE